ncbi:unnamed protein product [Bubo scandiacus]
MAWPGSKLSSAVDIHSFSGRSGKKMKGSDTSPCSPFPQIQEFYGKPEKPAPLLVFSSHLNDWISYQNMIKKRYYQDAESYVQNNDNQTALENSKGYCLYIRSGDPNAASSGS